MSLRDQLLSTATDWIQALDKEDWAKAELLLAPDAVHLWGPNLLFGPERNNKEYIEMEKGFFSALTSHSITVTDRVVDEAQRVVVVYCTVRGEAAVGSYEADVVLKVTLTDDGKKVLKQYFFGDSRTLSEFVTKMQAGAKSD